MEIKEAVFSGLSVSIRKQNCNVFISDNILLRMMDNQNSNDKQDQAIQAIIIFSIDQRQRQQDELKSVLEQFAKDIDVGKNDQDTNPDFVGKLFDFLKGKTKNSRLKPADIEYKFGILMVLIFVLFRLK